MCWKTLVASNRKSVDLSCEAWCCLMYLKGPRWALQSRMAPRGPALGGNSGAIADSGFMSARINEQRERNTIALGGINLRMRKHVSPKSQLFYPVVLLAQILLVLILMGHIPISEPSPLMKKCLVLVGLGLCSRSVGSASLEHGLNGRRVIAVSYPQRGEKGFWAGSQPSSLQDNVWW